MSHRKACALSQQNDGSAFNTDEWINADQPADQTPNELASINSTENTIQSYSAGTNRTLLVVNTGEKRTVQ